MADAVRRIVVTGAAGVIGKATCRRLIDDGHRVMAVDVDKDGGSALLEELSAGDRLHFCAADVTNEFDVEAYVQEAVARLGGIDGFFNNAGIEGVVAPVTAYPTDVFDRVVAVNLRGVFLGLKHVMAAMAPAASGSIVNTASVAGLVGSPGMAAYIATKHAVVGITKTAAIEGAAMGVRVNAVCPGPVESRMMRSLEDGLAGLLTLPDRDAAAAAIRQQLPANRYARPEEVAALVAYLLSDSSSYISGAAIPIDWAGTAR